MWPVSFALKKKNASLFITCICHKASLPEDVQCRPCRHHVRASVQLSSAHHLWEEGNLQGTSCCWWVVSVTFVEDGKFHEFEQGCGESSVTLWPSRSLSQVPGPSNLEETESRQVDFEPGLILTWIKAKIELGDNCSALSPLFPFLLVLVTLS